jgi:CspA family cold shock protein
MTYRDEWAECEACGRDYVFTVEMQRRIEEKGEGKELARFCPECASSRMEEPEMRLDPTTGHWVGEIKWFDLDKGYGFIERGDGTDIFFHKTEVEGDPRGYVEGKLVTYDVEETLKGPQAITVSLYEPQSASS